jgi:hypothetical protein
MAKQRIVAYICNYVSTYVFMLLFVCLCIYELHMFINLDNKVTGLEPIYITDTPEKN